jgi:uncharacterized protein (TIGR03083 family)
MGTKDTAIQKLEKSWSQLRSVVESVPEEEVAAPGIVEEWSLKDLLGHMAFWSERAAVTVRAVDAGKPGDIPRGEGPNWVDEWNRREYLARKDKSFKDIRAEWITAHEHARKALEGTTDEALNQKFGQGKLIGYFEGDTWTHYDEHAEQIKTWLREMETTEK